MSEKLEVTLKIFNGVYLDKEGLYLHVELGENSLGVKAVRVTGPDLKQNDSVSIVYLLNSQEEITELGQLLYSCEYLGTL